MLWTASLFNADGLLVAGLGWGMYAEGATESAAIEDAARQLLVTLPTEGLTGIELKFAESTNARVADLHARGYRITVRRKQR
jgi:hypothetical protein